jgi:secondary thiamine-phosphate synthase enzyme
MAVISDAIHLNTTGNCDIIDITLEVATKITHSSLHAGILTIFVSGSTAGVTTLEYEPGLISDTKSLFDRIIPQDIEYHHNQNSEENGHAHMRASLLGPSLSIPFSNGKLTLGIWQQIVVIDFDNRPRSRDVILQIIGE